MNIRIALLIAAFAVISATIWYLEDKKSGGGATAPVASNSEIEIFLPVPETTETDETEPAEPASTPAPVATPPSATHDTATKKPQTPQDRIAAKLATYERAKEISTPDNFINTPPLTVQELIGKKVILVDFWTYSCINCQRTTPYLRAWDEKYRDKGLVILGIHTPEFKFEEKYENVLTATKNAGIQYPVIMDNDYSTWQAYKNRYWPRKYLIDIDGFIVYDHIGEGAYDVTEKKIQELLAERISVLGMNDAIAGGISKPAEAEEVDFSKPKSPEIYFGASRNDRFGNGAARTQTTSEFTAPDFLQTDMFYLDGTWTIRLEHAENLTPGARLLFRYRAEKLFMVAGSEKGSSVTVLRDDEPLGSAAGADIKDGSVYVKEERLYRLIEDPEGFGEHTIEIIIEKPGVQVFTFTFG